MQSVLLPDQFLLLTVEFAKIRHENVINISRPSSTSVYLFSLYYLFDYRWTFYLFMFWQAEIFRQI